MQGVPREVHYEFPESNMISDRFDIVQLEENLFMLSFYFGEERIQARIFANRTEMKETRDLIDDTLNLIV